MLVATTYRIIDSGGEYTTIERRSAMDKPEKWAVCNLGDVLNKNGQWEYEPQPSSRSDEFIECTRFDTVEEAYEAWISWKKANDKT